MTKTETPNMAHNVCVLPDTSLFWRGKHKFSLDCLTMEDMLSRNVANYQSTLCNISEERRSWRNIFGLAREARGKVGTWKPDSEHWIETATFSVRNKSCCIYCSWQRTLPSTPVSRHCPLWPYCFTLRNCIREIAWLNKSYSWAVTNVFVVLWTSQ